MDTQDLTLNIRMEEAPIRVRKNEAASEAVKRSAEVSEKQAAMKPRIEALDKRADVVKVGTNSYQVNRPEALKASEPSLRTGPRNASWWHWNLYVDLPNGEIAIFCTFIEPVRPRGNTEENLYPKTSRVPGRRDPVELTRSRGFTWRRRSLELLMESYRKKFGEAPEKLGCPFAKSTSRDFQREFARVRERSPELSVRRIADEAVQLMPFAKERIRLGYNHFDVSLLQFGDVTVDGVVLKDVPTAVWVEVSR